jgi:3-methyladenine DNA glycosylase AlkC
MSSLLKDVYSTEFYERLCDVMETSLEGFDRARFLTRIFSTEFAAMELKQRMSHTIEAIAEFLPGDFEAGAECLCGFVDDLKSAGISEQGFEFMFLPEYIETRGLDHFETAIASFEQVTQFTSCEFAVRPFIRQYGARMIERMTDWSTHDNHWVRRLASEGSRPRLPWAMALPALKQNPAPLLPLLENLKQDPSETVRRSVANNLNDISKDNPDFVVERLRAWQGCGPETDALLKHACRTLLKQAEPSVMAMFGYRLEGLAVRDFEVSTPTVEFGDGLEFSFVVENTGTSLLKLRLEYAVFKISERDLATGEILRVERRHPIRAITTRVYYPGIHRVAAIANGVESPATDFELRM